MRLGFAVAGVLVGALLSGCVPPQKYNWGEYESSLYGYYRDPTKAAQLTAALDAIIQSAEQTKTFVPPGVYAEYGYLLYQQGKTADAIVFFQKEKALWPESAFFMDAMIRNATDAANRKTGADKK